MRERGHERDALQCGVKVKELWNAYRKAHKANRHSGAAPVTCCFYKELDAILGGNPTSSQKTTMDTSEPSSTRPEEDSPASLDACSQELFSSQEKGRQSQRMVLGEGQTPEEVPNVLVNCWKWPTLIITIKGPPPLLSCW
ncbi:hypothetical protein UY3_00990 [Chelonia mydas]|uniref:Zinc finger and SCAN domain-containing protein 29 n=1 Tax=Chelonia mydas TaxID=8469 RepID=M7BX15_CHEMY|nr:hypothetical protein UY3_00990 [Chelonia mydas]